MMKWLQTRAFTVQFLAFLLMILPPIPMYYAVRNGQTGLLYFLLALVILGNILVLLVR